MRRSRDDRIEKNYDCRGEQTSQGSVFDKSRNRTTEQCLTLLKKYPTAKNLADASVKKVAALRGDSPRSHKIGEEKAGTLVSGAKNTIASDSTSQRARKIQRLVDEITLLKEQIDECEKELFDIVGEYQFPDQPGVKLQQPNSTDERIKQDIFLVDSIGGIGKWGAACFVGIAGDISRFAKFEKINAFIGTCPKYSRSGKKDACEGSMSKRGNRKLRWLLYMLALSASIQNPIIAEYYKKQLAAGKDKIKALCACMTKLLKLIYGVVKTRCVFDPNYLENKKKEKMQKD